jgi:hypothetical protein
MSFSEYTKNVDSLTNNIEGGSKFDISKFYMSDRDSAKALIKKKNPNLSDKNANMIIYGTYSKPSGNEAEVENKVQEYRNYPGKSYKPIDKDDAVFSEVKDTKSQVRNAVFELGEKSVSLASDLTNLTIFLASSIPAMAALIVSIPIPNIPAATSLLSLLFSNITSVKTKLKELVSLLEVTKKMDVVVEPDKMQQVLGILNPVVISIQTLSGSINSIDNNPNKPKCTPEQLNEKNSQLEEAQRNLDEIWSEDQLIKNQLREKYISDYINKNRILIGTDNGQGQIVSENTLYLRATGDYESQVEIRKDRVDAIKRDTQFLIKYGAPGGKISFRKDERFKGTSLIDNVEKTVPEVSNNTISRG